MYGGAHTMHDTKECCKYWKDGTPKKDFSRQKPHAQSRGSGPFYGSGSAYARLSAKVDKLKKSNWKLKLAQKKCKCSHKSDSKDSNSS